MTSLAFINYVIRHPKQFRYIELRKRHSEKVHRHERKSLSLLQSVYNRITISYNQLRHRLHSTSSSLKKRDRAKEKERMKRRRKKGKRWKRGEEGKEEEKEKQKMEKAIHERHRPLQRIFPSTKLGNNMTPIKGRLGKNTTPTSNNPVKLNQNLQTNSQKR